MQLWNKVLAFQSSFTEALVLEWRLLVERDREPYGVSKYHAFEMVETNKDLLAGLLQDRLCDVEALVCGLIDGAIRSMCPRTQQVGREAYRPIADTVHLARANEHLSLHFECESVHDYLVTFARCGVPPDAWVHFLRAIEWTLKTHVPYAREDDKDDIANGPHSSVLRALGQLVSIPAINAWKEISALVDSPLVRVALPRFWKRVGSAALAEISSKMLERMQSHPDVLVRPPRISLFSMNLSVASLTPPSSPLEFLNQVRRAFSARPAISCHIDRYHFKVHVAAYYQGRTLSIIRVRLGRGSSEGGTALMRVSSLGIHYDGMSRAFPASRREEISAQPLSSVGFRSQDHVSAPVFLYHQSLVGSNGSTREASRRSPSVLPAGPGRAEMERTAI